MTHSINRRTLIASATAAPLASLPVPAPAEETFVVHGLTMTHTEKMDPDPHLALFEQWRIAYKEYADCIDGPEEEAAWAESDRLGRLILETPARTLKGVLTQIEYWLEDYGHNGFWGVHKSPEARAIVAIRDSLKAGIA